MNPNELTLCGFSASNYYNKIKLQLLEKNVAFREELVWLDQVNTQDSPTGKVPFIKTPDGPVCESIAIAEYIEARYPDTPLLPANPYQAAKVRELVLHIELNLEVVARVLHPQALWGGKVGDSTIERQRKLLDKGIAALVTLLGDFDWPAKPYLVGEQLSLADCSALINLPVVGLVSKLIYGSDLLADALPYKTYLQAHAERPSLMQVRAEGKLGMGALMAKVKTDAAR